MWVRDWEPVTVWWGQIDRAAHNPSETHCPLCDHWPVPGDTSASTPELAITDGLRASPRVSVSGKTSCERKVKLKPGKAAVGLVGPRRHRANPENWNCLSKPVTMRENQCVASKPLICSFIKYQCSQRCFAAMHCVFVINEKCSEHQCN